MSSSDGDTGFISNRLICYSLASHISQAVVKGFKSTTKTLLGVGRGNVVDKGTKIKSTESSIVHHESKVKLKVYQGPGKPRIKQTQRKRTPPTSSKQSQMKAASVLHKGQFIHTQMAVNINILL